MIGLSLHDWYMITDKNPAVLVISFLFATRGFPYFSYDQWCTYSLATLHQVDRLNHWLGWVGWRDKAFHRINVSKGAHVLIEIYILEVHVVAFLGCLLGPIVQAQLPSVTSDRFLAPAIQVSASTVLVPYSPWILILHHKTGVAQVIVFVMKDHVMLLLPTQSHRSSLMTWRCKETGHLQQWYGPNVPIAVWSRIVCNTVFWFIANCLNVIWFKPLSEWQR